MMPVMMAPERNMESNSRARRRTISGRGTNVNRRRVSGVNDRRGLIDDRRSLDIDRLLHHHRLCLHHWLLNDDRLARKGLNSLNGHSLHDDRRGLMHHDGRGIDVNRSRGVNRLGRERAIQKQARSHACQNFSSSCPFLVSRETRGRRGAYHGRGCHCHQGFCHNVLCSVGLDGIGAKLFESAGATAARI